MRSKDRSDVVRRQGPAVARCRSPSCMARSWRLRSLLYRLGLRHRVRMKAPVVVVGNLTVGGTGKTPLVAWLSTHLAAVGMRVAIVSRGYGGRARGVTRVTVHSRPSEVGDEPLLLARRAQATVFVGARPRRGRESRGGRWGRHRHLRRWTAAPRADARLRNRGHRRTARLRQWLPAAARAVARDPAAAAPRECGGGERRHHRAGFHAAALSSRARISS